MNRIVVDRRPLLLLVSSASLLAVLVPARDVASLPHRLAEVVAARLIRMGIASELVEAEVAAMSPVIVARITNRSVLGILVDFAKSVKFHAPPWTEAKLRLVEAELAETPCFSGRRFEEVVFPERAVPALLARHGRV